MILTTIIKLENPSGMKKIKLEEIIHKLKRNVIKVNFFFFFLTRISGVSDNLYCSK